MKKVIGAFLAAGLMLGSLALPAAADESQIPTPPGLKIRSESRAFSASLTGTLVSWGLMFFASAAGAYDLGSVGLVALPLGPSLGYFGAGLTGRAIGGTVIRALGLAAVVGGAYLAWEDETLTLGGIGFFGGAALVLGSTIYDLATVKRAVRKRNSRIQGTSLNVAPVVAPKSKTVGLSLQLAF